MRLAPTWDRRTFLAWGIGALLLMGSSPPEASETAVAVLRIDGMTCGA